MIQQLFEMLGRSTMIGHFDDLVTSVNTELPPLTADYYLKVNSLGTGFEFVDATSIISEAGSGLPTGGDTGDFLQKDSAADGDATWRTGAYNGFSSRYNQNVALAGLKETMDFIMNMQYAGPLVSLTASGSGTVREKGASVASTLLTAAVTRRSDPIAAVRFYLSPSTLLDTQVAGGAIPSGGNSTYTYSTPFSDNVSFYAQADDTGATGGPTTATSNTVTFTFVYPYYFGSGAAALTPAAVAALTKDIRVSTSNLNRTFTPNGSQVLYFAYPASYGGLTSILDQNGFETIGDWTLRTQNITGLDATAQSYRIYEYNNTPVAGTYSFTFIR